MILLIITGATVLAGCSFHSDQGQIQNIGMLTESSIDNQVWEEKGYKGLLQIKEKYDVKIYYKENITTEQEIGKAVDTFVHDGVNLIFGHSNIYGKYFVELSDAYPNVHFVYFNGGYFSGNVTSMNFNAHAMGFFAGMLASKMSNTDQVGIISAFEWQPEIEGFYEGAKFENPSINVHINNINGWNDKVIALQMYEKMRDNDVDVIYPAGNSFSGEIIKRASEDGIFAIGYVIDQSGFAPSTVLMSTVQHVDKLYKKSADMLNEGELEGTIMSFDFQDEIISLGTFSPVVPDSYQSYIAKAVEEYKVTGLLPNEQE